MATFLDYLMIGGALAAWLLLGGIAAAHAIMYKRDPRAATIWLIISFGLPVLGPAMYWGLGINRIQRRAREHLGRREKPFTAADASTLLNDTTPSSAQAIPRTDQVIGHLSGLRSVADRITRLPLLPGNAIVPLHNGEEAYPRMLEAIGNAQRSVTLASYIFDWDDTGREFAHALGQAAERGVKVHVLVDGIGAVHSFSRMGRLLLRSGAHVAAFFPLRFPFGRLRINLRNHRKILVVDGLVGFTGGMNISQRHLVTRSDPRRVEDLHFHVTGPVVSEMQHAFVEDWSLATRQNLEGDAYFPKLVPSGPAACRGISSGPDEDLEIIHWILLASLASARDTVRIITPYFVPTWPLTSAMALCAMSGVDIALILPSKVDHPYMRWAADAYLWELLGYGVRVYRRPPPFVHSKLMIVDERWVLIGSANLDRRSFRLHFEFDVEVYDPELAASLTAWTNELIAQSQPVTLDEVESRPTARRLRDGLAKIVSPHL